MTSARQLAIEAVTRIERDRAYANLVLPALLARSDLDERDRAFATELVYGSTRMRRACDWLVDRFVLREPDAVARAVLRVGAYQLAFLDTPAHAAVGATVDAAPPKLRGLANAVLRKVAEAPREWPDEPTRLSYPDWIVERLVADLGADAASGALEAMNQAAQARTRPDGYVQDLASQWVAETVGATHGMRVLDACAAPGGKATWMAGTGANVVAADLSEKRTRLVATNASRLGADRVLALVADSTVSPFRRASFDRILVDAPCSGLGTLRRRADARWRIEPGDIDRLARLQRALVDAAVPLLTDSGILVYSVCTLTEAETTDIDDHIAKSHPELVPLDPPGVPWVSVGRGARLLPQAAGTDGMYVLILRARDCA